MSVDYLIITSSEYDIQNFVERIPNGSNISLTEALMGGYVIENQDNDYYCWFRTYDHTEDGLSSFRDEDAYDQKQLTTILQHFQQPKFFLASAPCKEYLYWIITLIANTDDVLVDNSMYDADILTGSEFVNRIKAGEKL